MDQPNQQHLINFAFLIFILLLFSASFSRDIFDDPVFSNERGFYENPFVLRISVGIPDAKIKYTFDGTDPRTSATAFSQFAPALISIDPMDITHRDRAPGVVIRACAVKDNIIITKVATHTFLFLNKIRELSPDNQRPGNEWPLPSGGDHEQQSMDYGLDLNVLFDPRYCDDFDAALTSLPSLSMVLPLTNLFDPDSGIYVNALRHGRAWEKFTSLELLNPDGTPGFQVNAGVRIRGAWGRRGINPKHAFRLFFREEYGDDKLRYPLFGDEGVSEYDKVDLRCSQNYSWAFFGDDRNTLLREVFSRDTQRDMGQPYTRSRFYHLYINGTYFGVYQTQERSEAAFGADYFGGSRDDYDVIKTEIGDDLDVYEIEATDGNLDAYRRLWQQTTRGFLTDESYYAVQGLNPDGSRNPDFEKLVDLDNLIDYMLCSFYVGDTDGPVASNGAGPNNFYAVYNRKNPDGFKYFRHDAEHTLFNPVANVTRPQNIGQHFEHFNPKWLHQKLALHPEYRLRFADRVYKHCFNRGALTPNVARDRILARKKQIDLAIIAESARWGDAKLEPPRTKDDHWLPEVEKILDEFIPPRTEILLEQLEELNLYPEFNPPTFSVTSGIVSKGTIVRLYADAGETYFTTDGNDPHPAVSQEDLKTTMANPSRV
jgi:hypothetical protein